MTIYILIHSAKLAGASMCCHLFYEGERMNICHCHHFTCISHLMKVENPQFICVSVCLSVSVSVFVSVHVHIYTCACAYRCTCTCIDRLAPDGLYCFFRSLKSYHLLTVTVLFCHRGNFHKSQTTYIAYVRFKNKETAIKALEANNKEYMGKHLQVDLATGNRKIDGKCSVFVGNLPFGELLYIATFFFLVWYFV